MSNKVNYMVIGIYVILFFCASIFILFWLYYKEGHVVYKPYMLYVHDDVTGLSSQSSVKYTGVQVGYVDSIKLDDKNPQLVQIVLQIKAGTPVLTSTFATLNVQGITGSAYVSLSAGSSDAPLLQLQDGQIYPVIKSKTSLLNQVTNALPEIADNIQTITKRINTMLSADNVDTVSKILDNVEQFTGTLSSTSPDLNKIMKSLNVTMKNAEESSNKLPDLLEQTNHTMTTIKRTVDEMQKTTKDFSRVLLSAETLITNTTQQLLPSTNTFILRLSKLSSSLDKLSTEVSHNPSILVRGKAPAKLGPGESR